MKDITKEVNWIVKNWNKIPDSFKTNLGRGIEGLINEEDRMIVLILDRQKPSVQADYSFDEERIGVTKTGKVIWGFDSGCSCPSPWNDSFPECYSVSNKWKEFILNAEKFDIEWSKECVDRIEQIKASIKKK